MIHYINICRHKLSYPGVVPLNQRQTRKQVSEFLRVDHTNIRRRWHKNNTLPRYRIAKAKQVTINKHIATLAPRRNKSLFQPKKQTLDYNTINDKIKGSSEDQNKPHPVEHTSSEGYRKKITIAVRKRSTFTWFAAGDDRDLNERVQNLQTIEKKTWAASPTSRLVLRCPWPAASGVPSFCTGKVSEAWQGEADCLHYLATVFLLAGLWYVILNVFVLPVCFSLCCKKFILNHLIFCMSAFYSFFVSSRPKRYSLACTAFITPVAGVHLSPTCFFLFLRADCI